MLVDEDAAFGKRDSQMRGFDLKNETLKNDGVVLSHGAFLFDGENQIEVDVRQDRDKSGARLLGLDGKALIELADVDFFQETIGGFHRFDAMRAELVWESALKGFVDAYTAASGLRGISRDRANAEFRQGSSDLSQMAFLHGPAGLWGQEEVGSPVRVERAEDAVSGDAISQKGHAG